MMNNGEVKKAWQYLWLLAGLFFISMANGNAAPAAAWLGPLFFMRFVRHASLPGLAAAIIGLCGATILSLSGAFVNDSIPAVMRIIYPCLFGLVLYFPAFLADRILHRRLPGIAGSLFFPAVMVGIEYINSLVSPFSTFGLSAYTQYGSLPLVQLVSITGIWGLSFVMFWFAPVVNDAWERGFSSSELKGAAAAYVVVMILILTYGGIRLRRVDTGVTVKVAASSQTDEARRTFRNAVRTGQGPGLEADVKAFDSFIESASRCGADIVMWQEYALVVDEAGLEPLIEHISSKVKQRKIYCLVPMGVIVKRDGVTRLKNTAVLFDGQGYAVSRYVKSYTAPWETSESQIKEPAVTGTVFSRLATAICFDMDFPFLIRKAGRRDADIMLAPSMDWRGIAPFHSYMAVFRAVENGFSVVRPAGADGVSIAADCYGRVLGSSDNRYSRDRLMIVDVPVRGVRTVYSRIGDIFAWICLAGAVLLFVMALRNKAHS